jgi:uncharacterized protein YjbJ (UPF0337 family)
MNTTTLEGQGQNVAGNLKEGLGKAIGDTSLQSEGVTDQVVGNVKQAAGAAKDAIANPGPLLDKAKGFARDRPFAAAALVGVIGVALLNTLRGK